MKKPDKRSSQAQRRSPASPLSPKVETTRQRIITAGRQVFTQYPYQTASLRLIGQAGGFRHSLIRYHFETKDKLFEAVCEQIYSEYLTVLVPNFQIEEFSSSRDGLTSGIEFLLDFGFSKPDAFHLMMLNIGQAEQVEELGGGISYLRRFHSDILKSFSTYTPLPAPSRLASLWIYALMLTVVNFLGAPAYFMNSLGITSQNQYREYVKEILLFLFYPSLKALVFSSSEDLRRAPLKRQAKPTQRKINRQEEKKGEISRRHILDVARELFTQQPYSSVSIRMIADRGGFDNTLIYHYFTTKAELFEVVAEELSIEYQELMDTLLTTLKGVSLKENLTAFINHSVELYQKQPDALFLCIQNIAQINKLEDIPGADYLSQIILQSRQKGEQLFGISGKYTSLWFHGFSIILFNCLGAAIHYAKILQMDPAGLPYRRWVKDMLMLIFYPALQESVLS